MVSACTSPPAATRASRVLKKGFEDGKSTHFAIDRAGGIAQYIAASFQSQGQGDGNPNWLGVEIVGEGGGMKAQAMTEPQLTTLRELWKWVFSTFPAPDVELSGTLHGDKTGRHRPREALPEHGKGI